MIALYSLMICVFDMFKPVLLINIEDQGGKNTSFSDWKMSDVGVIVADVLLNTGYV